MLRDDNIKIIKYRLNNLYKDENKKLIYEAIVTLANNTMNMDVTVDEHGEHQVLWNNKKLGSESFDTDLENLVAYIDQLDH